MRTFRNRCTALVVRSSIVLWLGVLLTQTACETTDPAKTAPTASVLAPTRSAAALSQAILEVFNAEGYTPVTNSRTDFVFEKPAGTFSNIAYGSWLDPSVWLRVKVHVEPVDDSNYRLTADAFRIRDRGGSLEEQEHLGRTHASGYRTLLNAAASKAAGK